MKIIKQLDRMVGKAKIRLKKSSPEILTGLTIAGIFATGILSAKAGWKAKEDLDRIRDIREDEPTAFQKTRVAVKHAIPPVLTAGVTTACVIKNHQINKEIKDQLIASYILLDRTFREYKQEVRNKYGDDADHAIRERLKNATDEDKENPEVPLFYDTYGKRFFNLTWEQVIDAEYQLNRLFALRGHVTLNDFYSYLGLDWQVQGDDKGWSEYIGETIYGYQWIDFEHRLTKTDDGLECYIIEYPFPPHEDFLD